MFRRLGIFATLSLACAALAACAHAPKVVTRDRVIEAPKVLYVPIDPRLTAPVPVIAAKGPTCGLAVATARERAEALATANAKLASIATVQGTEARDWSCQPKAETVPVKPVHK